MTKEEKAAVKAEREARKAARKALEERIQKLLATNDEAVERAILALFARQTPSEQNAGQTTESNNRGLSAFHAESATYFAGWINKGNRLSGRFLDRARKMALYYYKQLADIAEEKERQTKQAA